MALDVDGFAVLRSMGAHPEAFAAIALEVARTARALVLKQITHKDTGLKIVRDIRAAVGPEAFSLITDGMSDAQIKALVLKLDRHNPELKTANEAARRLHVEALAGGLAEPMEKSKPARKPTPSNKIGAPLDSASRIQFSSAGATRRR
jgi:hypothetical protein